MNRNSTFSVLRKLKIIIYSVVLKFDFEFLFSKSCRRVALRKKVKVKLKRIKNINTVHFFQDTHENVCLIDCYCGKFAGNHFSVLKKHSDFIYLMYIV